MKKIVAWLMAGLLTWICLFGYGTTTAMASSNPAEPDLEAESAAASLKVLNLFAGTKTGFELYRTGTRAEGAVMLVRLLGRENEALSEKAAHPFRDAPVWAAGQIGLLYRAGLTSGTSAERFGSADPLTGRQFGAFVLRSLGYADGSADVYKQAVPLLLKLGLLDTDDAVAAAPDAPILRAGMVKMASRALALPRKGETRTLMDALVLKGQVPAPAAGQWLAASLAPKILGNKTGSYAQYLAFHDWIVNHDSYGYLPAADDPKRFLSSEGYTALSLGTGVCGAYAKAMQLLCWAAGLPCNVVQGEAIAVSGVWTGHAWNQVQIDGEWYQMDVTFDDPLGLTVLRYNYFNVTDADLEKDHRWDHASFPSCTSVAANWFVRNGRNVSSWQEFKQTLDEMVETRGTGIDLRIQPFQNNVYNEAAVRDVLTETGAVSGYTHSFDRVMGIIRLTDVHYFQKVAG